MSDPNCYLADENSQDPGAHFWFDHDCADQVPILRAKEAAGETISWDSVPSYQRALNHRRLPLSGDGWTLVSSDPLTISPSILCGECGLHGFWREGKWVSA